MGKKYISGYGDGFQAGWEAAMRQAQGLVPGGVDTSHEYTGEITFSPLEKNPTGQALMRLGALVINESFVEDAGFTPIPAMMVGELAMAAGVADPGPDGEVLAPGIQGVALWIAASMAGR